MKTRSVRAAAAWALGRIGTDEAHAALQDHHDDPEPLVRDAVRRAGSGERPTSEEGRPEGSKRPE